MKHIYRRKPMEQVLFCIAPTFGCNLSRRWYVGRRQRKPVPKLFSTFSTKIIQSRLRRSAGRRRLDDSWSNNTLPRGACANTVVKLLVWGVLRCSSMTIADVFLILGNTIKQFITNKVCIYKYECWLYDKAFLFTTERQVDEFEHRIPLVMSKCD